MPEKHTIEILQDTSDFAAVNKPSGVSVTKDRSGAGSIAELLAGKVQAGEKLRTATRLSKQVPGVVVLSKNMDFHKRLARSIVENTSASVYLAIVNGYVPERVGRTETGISRAKDPGRMKINEKSEAKAVTLWQQIADFGNLSLLAVRPLTARADQIRLHLDFEGMPLAIDPLYGNPKPLYLSEFKRKYRRSQKKTERPMVENLTLHAYQFEFAPELGGFAPAAAKPEKKFLAAVKMLAKHAGPREGAFINPKHYEQIINCEPLDELEIIEYEGREDGHTSGND
ncbi:pseudouridine synthase [Sedimentisphaera salicampi]|uniref:Ribosomal large subunit pseudouridine synthase C n=1 Tax=Sedimentisphaera salicampi TaxID=1941349 RepID=A0A1W6LLM8_9BACT|nr:pseudouridine synthase [Sedimentisphaera salicampi]ARN56667.1 Ribosomal large subunit pseudouridine synthase C [Sedimentisphaera salicampi]OXU15105.1 Ribosomal large subunit pseudouridine synthase C [Sedimentisphaera salicampi]